MFSISCSVKKKSLWCFSVMKHSMVVVCEKDILMVKAIKICVEHRMYVHHTILYNRKEDLQGYIIIINSGSSNGEWNLLPTFNDCVLKTEFFFATIFFNLLVSIIKLKRSLVFGWPLLYYSYERWGFEAADHVTSIALKENWWQIYNLDIDNTNINNNSTCFSAR